MTDTERYRRHGELVDFLTEVADGAADRDHERRAPHTLIDDVRTLRIGALRLPESQGGRGFSISELFGFIRALATADPNVPHILRNHFAFTEYRLAESDSPQRHRWLELIAAGNLFSTAATELGTTIGNSEYHTKATETAFGYELSGHKVYSTGCLYADWISIPFVTDDGTRHTAVLPSSTKGLQPHDDWDGTGQRLSASGSTTLDRVPVRHTDLLNNPPAAGDRTRSLASFFQLYLTTIVTGILDNVLIDARTVLRERNRTFAHGSATRAADDPLLQSIIGEISTGAFTAGVVWSAAVDALAAHIGSLSSEGFSPSASDQAALSAAKAKITIDKLGLDLANRAFDIGGASAVTRTWALDRHWRNMRTLASHNPDVYKLRAIGDLEINGTSLPATGFF